MRIAPDAIFRSSLSGSTAVVLGADAIEHLVPQEAWSVLVGVRSRVVLCYECRHPYDVLRPWTRCGFGEPEHPDEIPARVATLDARHVRPWVEFDQWLPRLPAHGSEAAEAATTVFHLRRLRVSTWANQLGWTRDRLCDVCMASFGLSAKSVLGNFAHAAYRIMRQDRATDVECADALGYFDAPTLKRALRREPAEMTPTIPRKQPVRAPQAALLRRSRVR